MAHALSEADQRWADFATRFLSAAILGPIALIGLWQGGPAWDGLIAVAMAGLGMEWSKLSGLAGSFAIPVFLLIGWAATLGGGVEFGLLSLLVLALVIKGFYGRFAAAGIPYAGIGGLSLLWLRGHDHGLADTAFLVVVVWGTDIGAYLVGRVIGGAKMAPRISPGKTWSGAAGGLVIGAICGALLAGLGNFDVSVLPAAAALSVCAQAGDLLESAIKRKLGVKDSGRTIPGHGGLFDRLDGFLAAAPLAALFALLAQGGLPAWR